MSGRAIKKATANVSSVVRIIDSTDGTPETGVTSATGGLAFNYRREGAVAVAITALNDLSALTDAHTDGGILHIGDGYYRVDFQDAAFATGANGVLLTGTATGMVVIGTYHMLVDYDPYDTVRLGLTALPNAAADAAGGLPISDAGGLDLDTQLAATNEVTAARMGALTDWINGGRLDLILDIIAADVVNVDGSAIPTAAAIADAVWDEILTGATHNIATSAGRRLRQIQEAGGYSAGAIYIDTVNGTAGTTDFENGVDSNPVDSIADANTLAASIGISTFIIAPGSSITFAAAQNNQSFIGRGAWTLALGGQDIAGSFFANATVSGIASGTGTTQKFVDCLMNATSHIKGTHLLTSGIQAAQTLVEAGDHFWDRCHSAIAGTATPTLNWGTAIGNSNVNIRNYSGGIQFEAMGDTGTDTCSLEGRGQLVEGTCTGGTVAMRGLFTTSGITNLTLSDNARYDTLQVNAQADLAISDAALATAANLAIVAADLPNVFTKNVALADFPFQMIDSADNVSPKTGLTVTATRSLDGAAFGAAANAVSEVSTGWYKIDLAAGDLNGNTVALRFTASGALDTNITIVTQPT